MPASLIRSRAIVTNAIDRHHWNEEADGAVLQEDGTIGENSPAPPPRGAFHYVPRYSIMTQITREIYARFLPGNRQKFPCI